MIRRPPRSTRVRSSAASDVYKRQADAVVLAALVFGMDIHGLRRTMLARERNRQLDLVEVHFLGAEMLVGVVDALRPPRRAERDARTVGERDRALVAVQ